MRTGLSAASPCRHVDDDEAIDPSRSSRGAEPRPATERANRSCASDYSAGLVQECAPLSQVEQIDRSLVAIFDIEGFSKRNPAHMTRVVQAFVERLDQQLESLAALKPDAFSTGDGAIVSIGRGCIIDEAATAGFLDFVVGFTKDALKSNLVLRTAVHYSEGDQVISVAASRHVRGEYIQVGDTINIATRILTFCEPREIMFSEAVYGLLRRFDLEERYALHENQPFITKHEEVLKTRTYAPASTEPELYRPDAPEHPYKIYTNFPPIKSDTLRFFMDNGLDFELKKVVDNAYQSMRHINDTMSFASWNVVLNVLTSLTYDPADTIYVLSRNDHPSGFWTQKRRNLYLRYLRANAERHEGYINQRRVLVWDDSVEDVMADTDKELFDALVDLHETRSLINFPASRLFKYERLAELSFGFTLSEKHQYAIISVPAPEGVDAARFTGDRIGDLLDAYRDYDQRDGPMKAIITADEPYVCELLKEIKDLFGDPHSSWLK
jgi:hypothetical protein